MSSTPYRNRRTLKPHSIDPERELPRFVLDDLLEDANWAPTHGLTQPWRFHVFLGDGRRRLAEALQSIYDLITPIADRREEKRLKLRENTIQAPVVVAVFAHTETNGKIPKQEEICATACAVQNLMLSAHEKGIGSFWSTAPASCSEAFVRWLDLDERFTPLGLVYLGYPKYSIQTASTRLPVSQRTTYHEKG